MLNEQLDCHHYCKKSSKCKKLFAYEETLEAMREVMEPRFDRKIEFARKRLAELQREATRLRYRIGRCMHVQKRLTYKEGYRIWYPSAGEEIIPGPPFNH